MNTQARERYESLRSKVESWSKAYYEEDTPLVTDEEFDAAMHELLSLIHI